MGNEASTRDQAIDSIALDYQGPTAKPTRTRYGVLAFLCTLALLLYVDRVCIGQAAPKIREVLGLSRTQMGWIFNAFALAYALFEVPTGHWGDRYGSRGVIARIVIWWSIFTALTGAAFGFWSLILVRFLFGAGEAGAYPNASRVVTRWFPTEKRGLARGSITFVSFIGAAVAPVIAAYLIERVGWRMTFAVFGAVGVAWAAGFYWWFRDNPAEHSGVNAGELGLIGVGVAEPAGNTGPTFSTQAAPPGAIPLNYLPASESVRIPWDRVLGSRSTWLLGVIMGVNSILFYMLFQWFPTYLKEARGMGGISSGWLTACVMMGGAAGCVLGGVLADRVVRRARGGLRWRQSVCGAGGLFLAACAVAGIRFMPSAGLVAMCSALAMCFMQMGIPTWWAAVAQISGRHGAAMWGLMNSLGGLGAMGCTFLVGWYVDRSELAHRPSLHTWQGVFDGVAISLAVGAACWLAVDSTRSIVEARPAL